MSRNASFISANLIRIITVLWDVHGECKNYNVLEGHNNAVLDLKWAPDGMKVSDFDQSNHLQEDSIEATTHSRFYRPHNTSRSSPHLLIRL